MSMDFPTPKKALGQHWIFDENVLTAIVETAGIERGDVVLEVGPGLGSLTMHLLERGAKVIAVEKDETLIHTLKKQQYFKDAIESNDLTLEHEDILKFDLQTLPENYKTVANIPYYLTSNLLRVLLESDRKPTTITVLVQKEVAERVVAHPGEMSVLALSVQYYGKPKIAGYVDKELFEPPPEVDSAILHIAVREKPVFAADREKLFRLIKGGFAEKRKLLKNSLAGSLHMEKDEVETIIRAAGLEDKPRAQELSLEEWKALYDTFVLHEQL